MKISFLNKFLPIFAVILMIIIQQKQQNNYIKKDKDVSKNINISETYLNLEEAKIASKELKKDILIIFETEWCGTCRKFKESIFDTKEMENYIVCFLDIDKDKVTADKYSIKSLPYYIVVNNNGEVKKRGSGYKSKIIFLNWLTGAGLKNNFPIGESLRRE